MSDDLTFSEKAVLLILMAEAREIPNGDLRNVHKTDLKKANREKLQRQGLIQVRTEKRLLQLELTDLGWKRCMAEFGLPVPPAAGAGGAALYSILDAIKRYIDRSDIPYAEFFVPPVPPVPLAAVPPGEIEARIRAAYDVLSNGSGRVVRLADVRDRLGDLDRAAVDSVLVAMNRTEGVRIVPESNQKSLTARERAAAVVIGNQKKHLIAIGL